MSAILIHAGAGWSGGKQGHVQDLLFVHLPLRSVPVPLLFLNLQYCYRRARSTGLAVGTLRGARAPVGSSHNHIQSGTVVRDRLGRRPSSCRRRPRPFPSRHRTGAAVWLVGLVSVSDTSLARCPYGYASSDTYIDPKRRTQFGWLCGPERSEARRPSRSRSLVCREETVEDGYRGAVGKAVGTSRLKTGQQRRRDGE